MMWNSVRHESDAFTEAGAASGRAAAAERVAAGAVSKFPAEFYALDRERIEQYRERGFVKLEQVISGEPLRYFREVIGYAVGHYFVDDDRVPRNKRMCDRSFLQAYNLAVAPTGCAAAIRSINPPPRNWHRLGT